MSTSDDAFAVIRHRYDPELVVAYNGVPIVSISVGYARTFAAALLASSAAALLASEIQETP